VNANRLPSLVVDEVDFRKTQQNGATLPDFVRHFDAAADDLLWGNAVDALDPRPHELDSAPGNEGLERLRGLPFRVLWRERPDSIEGECELKVHRLLGP
jgi:hypothetical protein